MADAATIETRSIHRGKIVDLEVQTVRLPNDHVVEMEIVHHPGAAAVLPLDAGGRVLLVRQYRHATGGYLLEVPAGKLDKGEAPETCAKREIEEETGRKAKDLVPLGWIWTTPGFADEKIWLFLATGLTESKQSLQKDEVISVEHVPLGEAILMAERGEITDAKSVCALLRVKYAMRANT
jgi:ADP-ribose pyrophosphatase